MASRTGVTIPASEHQALRISAAIHNTRQQALLGRLIAIVDGLKRGQLEPLEAFASFLKNADPEALNRVNDAIAREMGRLNSAEPDPAKFGARTQNKKSITRSKLLK